MDRLRLLSYNIQAGIHSRRYRDYVSNGWKHLLPHGERQRNLTSIGALLKGYDVVGLQEVDAGSLRSNFVDQTEFLARVGGFPFWHKQVNRELGSLARHSNGMLSRLRPSRVVSHKLPGMPGRGALLIEYRTTHQEPLAICVLHLALGWRARRLQLDYLVEMAERYRFIVLMGDFNCGCRSLTLKRAIHRAGLRGFDCELKTFPSWRPQRNLDHILTSSELGISAARVLDYALSDHLPLSMEVVLPDGVRVGV
ncbi:MAG TPA: endonuclease [Chromatiaceae bacterium]|jgi:endonuclease/exonuclease/phosphatase family metal-dependent hydrolase|nr:MAG: endonuclease [Thiohalocapsa sp. PB-PSB1]HBG95254.1 endonuclease [Chromatiaceae bacterium]HCS90539.1 endonuclease [Chromatiaceae bacterium]